MPIALSTPKISDTDILKMYQTVLPLIYSNPENLDLPYQINRQIYGFVNFDFLHYCFEETDTPEKWISTKSITMTGFGELESKSVTLDASGDDFDLKVRSNYEQVRDLHIQRRPEHREFFYYELRDTESPQIAIGFARHKDMQKDNSFSEREISIFEQLRPHVLTLFRTVLAVHMLTDKYRYFDTLSILSSKIANEFDLSEAEIKIIPDILIGQTNDEIADTHFVSVATIKTHINRIFKKTGVKNRVDFISKFFTNPDEVEL